MSVLYSEFDPFAAAWLRELIDDGQLPQGVVDERDIRDVSADDVQRFGTAHFFAGIGGWPYALRLAGWPDDCPVWTASLPCQPFSQAGKRKGHADERHLWPVFKSLVAESMPATIFGEQVASRDGREWFAGVRDDLEGLGYAVACADLCAASVGAPHIRQRLYWVAYTDIDRRTDRNGKTNNTLHRNQSSRFCGYMPSRMVNPDRPGHLPRKQTSTSTGHGNAVESTGGIDWMDDSAIARQSRPNGTVESVQRSQSRGVWSEYRVVPCRDPKRGIVYRRFEPGSFPLVARLPKGVATRCRTGSLKGYGNAIVPEVAAMFVRAFME